MTDSAPNVPDPNPKTEILWRWVAASLVLPHRGPLWLAEATSCFWMHRIGAIRVSHELAVEQRELVRWLEN